MEGGGGGGRGRGAINAENFFCRDEEREGREDSFCFRLKSTTLQLKGFSAGSCTGAVAVLGLSRI